MTSTKRKKRKPSSSLLSRRQSQPHSQPALADKPLASKVSRRLIRAHHTTQKRIHQALRQNDTATATALSSTLASSGGLAAYQRASVSGQSSKRGGDSSRVLVDWFLELNVFSHTPQSDGHDHDTDTINNDDKPGKTARLRSRSHSASVPRPRLLEIGCLSPSNAIHAFFPRTRRTLMDLNSLHPEILKQDFMTFPVPTGTDTAPPSSSSASSRTRPRNKNALHDDPAEEECSEGQECEDEHHGYDIISCSLVLNYVATPAGRGDMLKRIARFAHHNLLHHHRRQRSLTDNSNRAGTTSCNSGDAVFPALFLVLPAPCVTNSRYLSEDHLQRIMASLGFEMLRRKLSPKLVYYLWRYTGGASGGTFKKVELRPGGKRNNFAIVVE
ncbi:hypothetical protein Dda_0889 [Drechslerella dactyloides]|uniref:25S rRNA adenine-N(1) methyltransferase n=1 Tax=Drechslerella dactyloides TaxID=74499 RepID=A0AAD6J570_DREDA|nr:hypothetical protein Dda_0889 [Drechslerella dactyloides]